MEISIIKDIFLLLDYINNIFPQVDAELNRWKRAAQKIQCPELSKQALLSIQHKKFHAQGGAVYALYPNSKRNGIVRFIVAFQTISDYLDNLCDRMDYTDEKGMRQLHLAFEEALEPQNKTKSDYFKFYPYNDGGYINSLVDECKTTLIDFAGYDTVYRSVKKQACLYSYMQTYKHMSHDIRIYKVKEWANQNNCSDMGINEWEYAAAAGSTLNIFALCSMASKSILNPKEVDDVVNAYFPWVCGLHILLDYFIDLDEDRINDDLNFVSFYENTCECKERMFFFFKKAIDAVKRLSYPKFHLLIIRGLLSVYLSDSKVTGKQMKYVKNAMIAGSRSIQTKYMYYVCKFLRLREKL